MLANSNAYSGLRKAFRAAKFGQTSLSAWMHTGLEYWRDAVQGGVSTDAVKRLANAAGYEDVLRRSVDGALAFFDTEPEVNITFRDIGMFGLGVLALHLDAQGGITHRRLAELGSTSAILSSGRASAMLGLMRVKKLAQREARAQAGGQVRYLPAPSLIHFFNTRMKLEFSALAHVEPALTPFLGMWDAATTFKHLMRIFGTMLTRARHNPAPELEALRLVSTQRAGFLILYDLITRSDRGGAFPSIEPFDIGVSDIARRFSVGRAQVGRVLKQLEDSRFLARDIKAGKGEFLSEFPAEMKRYMATWHVALMACAHDAMQPEA